MGEGTVETLVAAGATPVPRRVAGPAGEPVDAVLAVSGDRVIVEMAQASGLRHLQGRPRPLVAGTFGTGQLIRAALDLGCRSIMLAVGGSATTDAGAGMLQALGARLLDSRGAGLPPGGAALRELAELDLSGLDPRLRECTFTLASDVDNPLLGPTGAAAVFAPQEGASDDDVAVLEAGLARFAGHVGAAVGRDQSTAAGSGAAGGTGFTALALLRAERRSGIDVVLDPAPFRPNCVVGGQM